jgi:NAD(P)-dependent dehydrogenase (short-subunit alcohol dehydrogenase family)
MQDLDGKVAFITGGASGIGLGIAKAFVGAGMKVVIADIRQDHIDQALDYFASLQKNRVVHGVKLDVTDRDAFAAAADEAERTFGPVDVLVNNAGVGVEGPIKQATYDDWDWGVNVNLGGVINGVRTFVPRMVARGKGGHIVSTASMAGITPAPRNLAIYSATKAAIVGLSEGIREEMADENIGVSVLCPGTYKTNIREAGQNRQERYRKDSGYVEVEERLSRREDEPSWRDPEDAGERVLAAVKANDLYILTHGEFKPWAERRFKAILDAYPEPDPNTPEFNMNHRPGVKHG